MPLAVFVHSLTSESGFYSSAESSFCTPLSIKLSEERFFLRNSKFSLADPRELFSRKHVHDAGSADASFHGHKCGVIVGHFTYDCGLGSERMSPDSGEHGVS